VGQEQTVQRWRDLGDKEVMSTRLCAAALLVAATLGGGAAQAADEIRLQANPPRIVLGKDGSADLSILIDVVGVVSDVKLYTNVGTTSVAQPVDDRRWIARLEPPSEFFPQAAIVVAVATVDGQPYAGWTVVSMWGQGELEVVGEPGDPLDVKIGRRTYGPINADADGKASIPIEVAPGETEAHAGAAVIPLGGVDFPRMVGVALPPRVVVRRGLPARSELRFFGITPRGEPLDGAQLRLNPSRGDVAVPRKLAPGTFATTLTLPAGARPGAVDVRWRLKGSEATRGLVRVFAEKAAPMVVGDLDGFGDAGDGAATDLIIEAPARLVLGRDEKAEISVQLPPGMTPDDEPRLYANVGSFTNVRTQGSRVTATYIPPEEQYPQLGILSAVVEIDGKPHVGVRPLGLAGVGNVRVRGKPGKPVTLKIGEEEFGPITADRRGWAEIEAIVPPGVERGEGPLGAVQLGAAPFSRIVAVPLHPRLSADGRAETAIRIFAFTPAGIPLTDAAITLDVDRGNIAKPEPVAPGIFTVHYRAPSELGVASFVARLRGDAASVSSLALPIVTPRPDRIEVTFTPREFTAGSDAPAVKVLVLDEAGNPTAGAVSFRLSGATVGEVEQIARGRWQTTLQIPDKLPGRVLSVKVTARGVETTATLPLHASAPDRIATKSKLEKIVADGAQQSDVIVLVTDRFGNPVEGADVAAVADKGRFLGVEEMGLGQYRARYQAPLAYSGGAASLELRAGEGLVTQASVDLVPSRKLLLIGAHGGFIANLVALYAPTLALDATLQGSGLLDGFLVNLEVGGLYTMGESQITEGPLTGTQLSRQLAAVPIVATAGYRLRLGDASLIAAAGGEADYVYSVVGDVDEQFLSWGAVGQLAGAYHLGPGEVVVKARYTYGALQGDFGAASVWAGYAFEVF